MTGRGSQSDLNSRAGLPDRLQPLSPALTTCDRDVPFSSSQDRDPLGTDASTLLFKVHWAFSKHLRKGRRKKGRQAEREVGRREESRREKETRLEENF